MWPILELWGQGHRQSRILLLSGSPIDKEDQVIRLLSAVGIMKSDELVRWRLNGFGGGYYEQTGFREITDFCKTFCPEEYKALETRYPGINFPQGAKDAVLMVYQMFQTCIKTKMSHAMQPMQMPVQLHKANGYFNIDNESAAMLEEGLVKLAKAARYNPMNQTVNYGGQAMDAIGGITKALMEVEIAKMGLFWRLAEQTLNKYPTCKVILCLNYLDNIDALTEFLEVFRPLVLRGSMSAKERAETIAKFQAPTTEHRLLVGNFSVCSTGIDLDDKYGNFPRIMYASPQYNTITTYQLCHRVQRLDTKSDAHVYMVYGKREFGGDLVEETSILTALSRKGNVMRETVKEQSDAGVLFPCDFPTYIEN